MSFFNSTAEKTGGAIQTERYKVPLSSCRSSGFVMLLLLAGVRPALVQGTACPVTGLDILDSLSHRSVQW